MEQDRDLRFLNLGDQFVGFGGAVEPNSNLEFLSQSQSVGDILSPVGRDEQGFLSLEN